LVITGHFSGKINWLYLAVQLVRLCFRVTFLLHKMNIVNGLYGHGWRAKSEISVGSVGLGPIAVIDSDDDPIKVAIR